MGNKIITEKDFWVCSGGLMPAPMQTTQKTTKKVGDFKYITEKDTATISWIDFGCKKLMLVMALLAVAIALATVATGGAALIAICAAAAGAGAIFGAVLGSLLCGQLAAAARMWLDNKSDLIIQGQKAITGDHKMTCMIFGETITFAPEIKNWWQAIALGTSNFIGEVLKNMMYGAAIGAGAAVITGGPAVLSQFGLSNIGANWLATWGGWGLGLRGLMGAQSILGAYGRTGQVTGGDVLSGAFAMEVGTYHAATNILTGKGTMDDFLGVAMWMLPAPKPSRRSTNEEVKNPNEEVRNEEVKEEETSQARTNEAETPAQQGEHNAFEQDKGTKPTQVDSVKQGFDNLAAKRKQMGLPEAGSQGDKATLAKLKIGGEEFDGVNSGLQNPKTKITLKANAQTKTHAEAEVVQKAIDAGKKGTAKEAEMWTDRDACIACGEKNGIGSLARELGVEKIIVHSPSGTKVYYPPKPK